MVSRVGIVQPAKDGFVFNIQADGSPSRILVVRFADRAAAQIARDKVYEALEGAASVSTATLD